MDRITQALDQLIRLLAMMEWKELGIETTERQESVHSRHPQEYQERRFWVVFALLVVNMSIG